MSNKTARLGRIISLLTMPLLVGAAVFLLVRDSQQLAEIEFQLNPWPILLSFMVQCAGILVAIPIWRQILLAHQLRFPLHEDIRIYCYSLLGSVVPGRIWTILGRASLYRQLGGQSLPVLAASLMETVITGIASMGLYALLTILQPEISLWNNPTLSLLIALAMFALIHPRIFKGVLNWLFARTRQVVPEQIQYTYWRLMAWVGVEMLVVLLGGFSMYLLLASFTPVSLTYLVPIMAAWAAGVAAGTLFFWMPGTPLLRDGAVVIALSPLLPLAITVAFVVLIRIWTIVSLLLITGLVWLLVDRPNRATRAKFIESLPESEPK
jgi:glycosyltransferase 2 family protein